MKSKKEKKEHQVMIRLTATLLQFANIQAEKERITRSAWIVRLIGAEYDANQAVRKVSKKDIAALDAALAEEECNA